MKLPMRWVAPTLCLGLGLVSPAHAADPGWYLLGFGGESSASVDQAEMDDNLVALFESGGLDVVDLSSMVDDSDTGLGLAGGYQINDHFALEFAYIDLGSVEYRAAATVSNGTDQADADVILGSSIDGPVLSALGILPVGERFSLFGRAGFSLMSAQGTARITIEGDSQRLSQSDQQSNFMFGAGVEYALSRHFAVRLAWDRYLDVGTSDVVGDADADLFSLGIRMGVGWFR